MALQGSAGSQQAMLLETPTNLYCVPNATAVHCNVIAGQGRSGQGRVTQSALLALLRVYQFVQWQPTLLDAFPQSL